MTKDDFVSKLNTKIIQQIITQNSLSTTKDIKIVILNHEELSKNLPKTAYIETNFGYNSKLVGKTVGTICFYDNQNVLLSKDKLITNVTLYDYFLKTKKMINKGEEVTSKDVEQVYEDNYGKPIYSYRHLEELKNKKALLNISKNVYLASFMFRIDPTIKRNEPVSLLLKQSLLEIAIKGQALEDGYVGKKIRVKTLLDGQKVLEGEVVDRQTVRIDSVN